MLHHTIPETNCEELCRDHKHVRYMRLTLETILDKGLDDGEQRRLKVSAMRVIH